MKKRGCIAGVLLLILAISTAAQTPAPPAAHSVRQHNAPLHHLVASGIFAPSMRA